MSSGTFADLKADQLTISPVSLGLTVALGTLVTLIAVLRPARKATQVELSKSDCMELGVKAPVRESGDVAGSGAITIEGPCGTLELKEGVIIAHNHIHVTAPDSKLLDLKDKQRVSVAVMSERPVIFPGCHHPGEHGI